MASYLRIVNHKRIWDRDAEQVFDAGPGDVIADTLNGTRTIGNRLSLYEVGADEKLTIERIVTAHAATRQTPDKIDFVVFDSGVLKKIKIQVEKNDGDTPDSLVNSCHYDCIELTATAVVHFCVNVRQKCTVGRFTASEVKKLIRDAITQKALDKARINEDLLPKVSSD